MLVAIKLGIVLLVIVPGSVFIDANNCIAVRPAQIRVAGGRGCHGSTTVLLQDHGLLAGRVRLVSGIFTGAALVFFAYIGFDVVATAAEETKKPKRDMPIGILRSLAICTFALHLRLAGRSPGW